ncbi:hypothetical protein LOK49_LG06G00837 [Camellia lanceoleosa]|uniref:Uncharacterized protein n=1 Tax=Camellia lanceoleosa TaxID=1840588 RepID=A0ACC0HH34_9ERIC|nr:hypothetical protein LOK49_LG06G00837 [Camellia lanceoleosa]
MRCSSPSLSYGSGGGGSGTTKGIAAWETFGLPLRKVTHKHLSKMTFGCSNNYKGFAFDSNKDNAISGLLGLAKGQGSLINQVNHTVNGRFFYCLHDERSYVRFDSGVPVSAIKGKAYDKAIRAFAYYYAGKLERTYGENTQLDLWYKYDETFQEYPSITFRFQGADFVVDSRFMYLSFHEARHVYVAMVPSYNITMLGALQQWDMRIVYDIDANSLEFGRQSVQMTGDDEISFFYKDNTNYRTDYRKYTWSEESFSMCSIFIKCCC